MPHIRKLILSIDGGGMRGLVAVRVLQALESRLRHQGIQTPLASLFDLICGTSTGGLIAAGLSAPHPDGTAAKPATTVAELRALFEDHGAEIFLCSWPTRLRRFIVSRTGLLDTTFDSRPLEKRLQTCLGWASLRSALTGIVLPAFDLATRRPVLMTNGIGPDGGRADDYLFWQAVRAGTAAPGYFEPALVDNLSTGEQQSLIYGSVFAHDPALVAIMEAERLGWRPEEVLLVSIGTGLPEDNVGSFRGAADWGAFDWINPARGAPILSVIADSQAATTGPVARRMLNRAGSGHYIRINGILSSRAERFDDARPGNVRRLNESADRIIRDNARNLDAVAEAIREARSARRGERVAPAIAASR